MKLVSLFSGCGGIDCGLNKVGFETLYANDNATWCSKTFEKNSPDVIFYTGDVKDYLSFLKNEKILHPKKFDEIDLVAGGPPCPPFSKSRFYRKDKPRGLNDPSAENTINGYFDVVDFIKPRAFLFENVPGIAFKSHQESLDYILKRGEEIGYKLSWKILNAADFGVPQIRKRFFLIGFKEGKFKFPSPTHMKYSDGVLPNFELLPWVTAGEVLKDIDTEENADDTGHFAGGKYHDLLKDIPPGDNYLFYTEKRGHKNPQFKWRSRYWSFLLKLSPNLPSWTIQARRSNNMGPLHWRNRILRILEVKRLQSFPDNWYLHGTVEQQWRQIGNAVPPLLAQKLGEAILRQLNLNKNDE